jgi:hypothetical protein
MQIRFFLQAPYGVYKPSNPGTISSHSMLSSTVFQGFEPTKIKFHREESTLSQVLAILNERQCREIKKPGIKPSFIQICRRHIIILGRLYVNAFLRVTP